MVYKFNAASGDVEWSLTSKVIHIGLLHAFLQAMFFRTVCSSWKISTRMWVDVQHDGRLAECRWRRLRKFRNSILSTTPQSLADDRCSSAVQCARLGRKVNFEAGIIPLGGNSCPKCVYSIPVQETAKHRTKFGWPSLNDVEAKTRTRWNLLGVPNSPTDLSR